MANEKEKGGKGWGRRDPQKSLNKEMG
ncbi:hypothetical protein CCACVL1_26432 [Corchorus capsularis]|uniref:Uncharacterized protein n=1 Tax=Corchorus capsularis TaxID=210143 RepID=A0A1R3GES3_COCAP|nr:hypothetical protein CCACVL1_26432 [Corchorus capsularis]